MILRTTLTWDGQSVPEDEVAEVRLSFEERVMVLEVKAPFHDDPPPDAPPGSVPRLWEREVVELFVGSYDAAGVPVYVEVELGPRGHHLVLHLVGVRGVVRSGLPLEFVSKIDGNRWTGRAIVPSQLLPPGPWAAWRYNVTACHGVALSRRYLTAARLTALEPDFHRPHEWLPG